MINVDFREVARSMVKALSIREGEVVSVRGGLHIAAFLEEIALEVQCAGASVMLEIISDHLARRVAFEVPLEYLKRASLPARKKIEITDCVISIGSSEDPLLLSDLPEERSLAMASAAMPIMKLFSEMKKTRKLRTLGMGFPTPGRAEFFGLPFEEYHDLFWRAVLIDLPAMRRRQKAIAPFLDNAKKVRIESEKGTAITLSLEGRPLLLDSGIFDEEDIAAGNLTTNWPCGEVWVAPVEESAEGVAVFDQVFHQGRRIKDLRLAFSKGRVVDFSAEENAGVFASMLREAEGDCDVMAELGIGTNPEVTKVTGDTILDEKILGSVHLAIGNNSSFGGNSTSTMHKDMVIMCPSLFVNEKPLILGGKFCV
ncbi:MAG: aminopeptidase [Candidatus Eremiobacteraeota bacterium]|nr:aminopeptidase [Candidatus Eremiobacteraeota bacterium]